jgi:hypothetical protein
MTKTKAAYHLEELPELAGAVASVVTDRHAE